MKMTIGKPRKDRLAVGDIVILRMEQSAGVGKVVHVNHDTGEDRTIYWCSFPNRSDGYFERSDLHCDRLDGKEICGPQADQTHVF